MKKIYQTKIKHHYVWANYLRRWSKNMRDIYYTTSRGNIAFDSVRGIAKENDFYKITKLNKEHLECIDFFLKKSPENLQKTHTDTLSCFLKMQYFDSKFNELIKNDQDLFFSMQAFKSNAIENLHTSHEEEAKEILNSLANKDLLCLEKIDNIMYFMTFLGQQIARTKSFKENVVSGNIKWTTQDQAKCLQHCWWFISYMLGINIGQELFSRREEINFSLLINESKTPFITGDQPIVNINKDPTVIFDLYYPISPKIAFIGSQSKEYKKGEIHTNEKTVTMLNNKISQAANKHIFGDSLESLNPYIAKIGTHFKSLK